VSEGVADWVVAGVFLAGRTRPLRSARREVEGFMVKEEVPLGAPSSNE
jgi:hypothetical protein